MVAEVAESDRPIPLAHFLQRLKGTPDEVWSTLLRIDHAATNRPLSEWQSILDGYRDTPV